jgi:hypothetical protein
VAIILFVLVVAFGAVAAVTMAHSGGVQPAPFVQHIHPG